MPHRGRPNPNQSILNQQDARSKRRGKTETKTGCCYSADTLCSQSFLLACDRALSSPFNHEEPIHRPHDLCCECRNTLFWPPDIELDFTVLCGAAAFLSLACTVWRFNPTHRPSQKVNLHVCNIWTQLSFPLSNFPNSWNSLCCSTKHTLQ